MDPWGLGRALRRLVLVTFLTVIGPVAFDAHLVGFLVPTSGPFREDLKGDVTARACRFLCPIRLREGWDGVWWRFPLLHEGGDGL